MVKACGANRERTPLLPFIDLTTMVKACGANALLNIVELPVSQIQYLLRADRHAISGTNIFDCVMKRASCCDGEEATSHPFRHGFWVISRGGKNGTPAIRHFIKRDVREAASGVKRLTGPVWKFTCGTITKLEGRVSQVAAYGALHRTCQSLLEQALSCSELADVRFIFEDGMSLVSGHKAVLCEASEVFDAMFRGGFMEQNGVMKVQECSRDSFRCFLAFLYRGYPGKTLAEKADGRELWQLADMYNIAWVKEWLLAREISEANVLAVMQYAKEGQVDCDKLLKECLCLGASILARLAESPLLRGLCAAAVLELVQAHNNNEFLGRTCDVLTAFDFVEKWCEANGGVRACGEPAVLALLDCVELGRLPQDVMATLLAGSKLIQASPACLSQALRAVNIHEEEPQSHPMCIVWKELLKNCGRASQFCHVAVTGKAGKQTFAFTMNGHSSVYKHTCQALQLPNFNDIIIRSVGRAGEVTTQLLQPAGVCFTSRGELVVSDSILCRIHVYARDGAYSRRFGSQGRGHGEFMSPEGLALSSAGDIIVCDKGNGRVQVLTDQGNFVREIKCMLRDQEQQQYAPHHVAVCASGNIVVSLDKAGGNSGLLQIFTALGTHVATVKLNMQIKGMAVSPQNTILVTDSSSTEIATLSCMGELLASRSFPLCGLSIPVRGVKRKKRSDVTEVDKAGMVVDAVGNIFVLMRMERDLNLLHLK